MSITHKCTDCRACLKCFAHNCTNNLPPNEINESLENGWHVKKCYKCGNILQKFESLELLIKKKPKILNSK